MPVKSRSWRHRLSGDTLADKALRHLPLEGLSISTKLVAGFLTVSVIAVLIGFSGLYFIDRINNTLNNITDVAAPTVETSDDLIVNILEATNIGRKIIVENRKADFAPLIRAFESLNDAFASSFLDLQDLVKDETLLDELQVAKREQSQFVDHALAMITAHEHELDQKAKSADMLVRFDAAGAELMRALDTLADENEREMAKAEEEGDDLEKSGASGALINGVLGHLFDRDYPVVESALKLQRLIMEMRGIAGEFLADGVAANLPEKETAFRTLYEKALPHLDVLHDLTESNEDRTAVASFETMFTNWTDAAEGPGNLFATHHQMLEARLSAGQMAERMEINADNAAQALNRVAAVAAGISEGADEAAASAVGQASRAILILLVLALFGSMGLLWLVVATVVRPIRNLTEIMHSLGDSYGQPLSATGPAGDEVTQLRFAFNSLEAKVRQRTAELQQRSLELKQANTDLGHELAMRQGLERQLVHAQKLESLGTLAGGIAHDFNNMLYVILGCAKLALDALPKEDSTVPLIEQINQAAQRSSLIVNQILFFSRQEVPDRHPVDVADILRESVLLLRAGLLSSTDLNIDIEEDSGIVFADETQIQQVVVNLVTNAFQAHSDRKGVIDLSVRQVVVDADFADQHIALSAGPYVRISVSDDGDGISDDVLMKMFDPFFTTKAVGEGTGLGLAVVHGIVAAHDGAILVSTEPGHGTCFDVYFPACPPEALPEQAEKRPVTMHEG